MPTQEMTVRFTHAVASGATEYSNWIYTGGYNSCDVSHDWTGDIIAAMTWQGTNAPVHHTSQTFQPGTDAQIGAVKIFSVNNMTVATTPNDDDGGNAEESYENVLPKWIRLKTVESNTEAGAINVSINFKATS